MLLINEIIFYSLVTCLIHLEIFRSFYIFSDKTYPRVFAFIHVNKLHVDVHMYGTYIDSGLWDNDDKIKRCHTCRIIGQIVNIIYHTEHLLILL